MEKNRSIKCDVSKCMHNVQGENCNLETIKVTCGCDGVCTCCGDFVERD